MKSSAPKKVKYEFPMKLPSLNDYVNKCRTHPQAGNAMKTAVQKQLGRLIMAQGIKRMNPPVNVHFTWYEANKRRDKDNIISAQKYILDSLVQMHVLGDDNWDWINQIDHRVHLARDRKHIVHVVLEEIGK